MNDVQAIWYQIQIAQDEKEKFEMLRDVAEHNAMFMNPEGVQKIRAQRDNAQSFEMTDNDFNQMLEKQFGRKVTKNGEESQSAEELLQDVEFNKMQEYLDMELDEISFIPFE